MVSWHSIYHNFLSYACFGNWRVLTATLQGFFKASFLVIVTLCRGLKPWVWKETILTKFGTETLLFSESFNFLKLLVIFSLRLLKSYKHTRWPSHQWQFTFEVMRIFWQQAFHQKSTPLFIKFLVYTALKAGNIMKRWICIKFQFL